MNLFWLDLLRVILLLTVIAYAAWKDHKTGEVPNKIWLYFPFGLSLTFSKYSLNPSLFLPAFLSFLSTVVITVILYFMGGCGGADVKAFLTIAASLPITPFLSFNLLFMYPLNVIVVATFFSFIVASTKRKDNVRFLPYVFFSLLIALAV